MKALLLMLPFLIAGCSEEPIRLICEVDNSNYEFNVDYQSRSATSIKKYKDDPAYFEEYMVSRDKDYYYLQEKLGDDMQSEYKIHRRDLKLITSKNVPFSCEATLRQI
ncbi:hypothetical protein OAS63_06350 [Gammaproteobacteria bacterium]|nr:hypothetical protein [Gammaproteobacteria bacterium]